MTLVLVRARIFARTITHYKNLQAASRCEIQITSTFDVHLALDVVLLVLLWPVIDGFFIFRFLLPVSSRRLPGRTRTANGL